MQTRVRGLREALTREMRMEAILITSRGSHTSPETRVGLGLWVQMWRVMYSPREQEANAVAAHELTSYPRALKDDDYRCGRPGIRRAVVPERGATAIVGSASGTLMVIL